MVKAVFGSFGGARAADAYDFEATKFVPLFEGDYRVAKRVLAKLEQGSIPAKLTFPDRNGAASTASSCSS
jgi:hypothetical protein